MKNAFVILSLFAVGLMPLHEAGAQPNSYSKNGAPAAFAKVDLSTLTMLSFGGRGTKTCTVTGGVADYNATIQFTGKYPGLTNPDQVIISATCQSGSFGVANGTVISAGPTGIVVEVYGWVSDSKADAATPVFVTLFIGQLP